MSILVPPAKNYPNPLVAIPTRYRSAPPEGDKIVPCEIVWDEMASSEGAVYFNMQNNAVLDFSQIVSIKVDNSECGSNIKFIFNDTGEVISIPSGSPYSLVEVFSNSREFFVTAENAISGDVTRFILHNTVPPPVVVPTSIDQQNAIVPYINFGVGDTVIVPVGINGTIKNLSSSVYMQGNVAGNLQLRYLDGTGKDIAAFACATALNAQLNFVALNLTALAIRFENGVILRQEVATGNGSVHTNLFFVQP